MLAHRLRRWLNIKPTFVWCDVFGCFSRRCFWSMGWGSCGEAGRTFIIALSPKESINIYYHPLPTKARRYFVKKNRNQSGFFSIWIHHKCLRQLFLIHLNTYVMGLRPLEICWFLQCGDRLIRQNLTSLNVRFWRIKTVPALKGLRAGSLISRALIKGLKIFSNYVWCSLCGNQNCIHDKNIFWSTLEDGKNYMIFVLFLE